MPAAGSAPRPHPPPQAPSPRVCLWYPRNQGFQPVVLLHNSLHPIAGSSTSGERELKKAPRGQPLLRDTGGRPPEATASAGPLHPNTQRGERNKPSASGVFLQQGPLVLSWSHVSPAPVSGRMLAAASQGQQAWGGAAPERQRPSHRDPLYTPALPRPGKKPRADPCRGPSLAWRCLSGHGARGSPHPSGTWVAGHCRPPPLLPVLFSGQGKECSSRDLRTSGMSMAGATPIRSQLDMARREVLAGGV